MDDPVCYRSLPPRVLQKFLHTVHRVLSYSPPSLLSPFTLSPLSYSFLFSSLSLSFSSLSFSHSGFLSRPEFDRLQTKESRWKEIGLLPRAQPSVPRVSCNFYNFRVIDGCSFEDVNGSEKDGLLRGDAAHGVYVEYRVYWKHSRWEFKFRGWICHANSIELVSEMLRKRI